ncbi:MAG TPA: hypothetical protein VH394_12475 [Thermoanaerobaculia bacterium]|jgi:hypothetical protein|nr:hypothetical protein [Thermoanaerobaculia bacterium]
MRRHSLLLLFLAGILVLGASCPPPVPPGATLTARTERSQTDATLIVKGHGYTPGQGVTITIQNVPGKSENTICTRYPNPAGDFELQEPYALKQVPAGTDLPDVVVIGRDASGWSLIATTSASPYVIRF